MDLRLIESPDDFPRVDDALKVPSGLIGYSGFLSVELLISAYQKGIFPWFNKGEPVLWWSPDPRAVFYPTTTQPSRSLQKKLKRSDFQVFINRDFTATINECAKPTKDRPETWITELMIEAYQALHKVGFAHSVEVYRENRLIGGLYGVSFGRLFFGESMFHRATDASKIALFYLLWHCERNRFPIVDCQLPNAHLQSLGAKEVSRHTFLRYLKMYGNQKPAVDMWSMREITDNFSVERGAPCYKIQTTNY